MKERYSLEDWIEILQSNNVLGLLSTGLTIKEVAGILRDRKYTCSPDSLRKAMERLGYKKSKEQRLYYLKQQEDTIRFMNSIDIESFVDEVSHCRYYSCYLECFWERKNRETVSVEIDKDIYEDYKRLSEKNGCDFDEEYLIYALLKNLDEVDPVNKVREFALMEMREDKYFTDELIEFILAKEKEGYEINYLKNLCEDYDIDKMSEEEFNKIAIR